MKQISTLFLLIVLCACATGPLDEPEVRQSVVASGGEPETLVQLKTNLLNNKEGLGVSSEAIHDYFAFYGI